MLAPVTLAMSLIYPSEAGRPVNKPHVTLLAESMTALGLKSPITVRAATRVRDGVDAEVFEIVAGRHRFEAARQLNWKEIDVFVMEGDPDDAELWEIDENFARAELSEAQKADHHSRRMRILIAKGVVRGRGRPKEGGPKSYAEEAATSLGVSRKTVDNLLWQGNNIEPEILAEVMGTDLDRKVVLDELASTPRAEQASKLISIRDARSSVRPAADPLNDPEAHEKQLAALMAAWNRAAGVVREEFLLRIETPVFDRARA